jgi:hypothetical protein
MAGRCQASTYPRLFRCADLFRSAGPVVVVDAARGCPTDEIGGAARSQLTTREARGRTVREFPSVAEKKSQGISFAVTDFLAGLRLTGSERVLGALAIALAEGMDSSPPYVKARFAKELREVLTELAKAELSPENLALLAGIEQ